MAKVLLGLRNIYFCPTCEKVILEGEELPENSPDNSICCDDCGAWFHFVRVQTNTDPKIDFILIHTMLLKLYGFVTEF